MKKWTKNPLSLPYITRIDNDRTHAYQVRVPANCSRSGKPFSMMFSDGVFGSADKAREVAIKQRDSVLRAESDRPKPRSRGHLKTFVLNRTGVPGVRFVEQIKKGVSYLYWRVFWQENCETMSQQVSIAEHGYERAWRLACRKRREMTGLAVPRRPPPPLSEMLSATTPGGLPRAPMPAQSGTASADRPRTISRQPSKGR